MIKVTVELMSAISRDRDRVLGVMMIDNVTTAEDIAEKQGKSCDYHGEIRRAPEFVKATRHAVVEKYLLGILQLRRFHERKNAEREGGLPVRRPCCLE